MDKLRKKCEDILGLADIDLSGVRPWDLKVHNNNFFDRIFSEGSLALGEGYMDGWWDTQSVDQFICKLLSSNVSGKINPYKVLVLSLQAKLTNLQNLKRAMQVADNHYNLGNRLFEIMLDSRMTYTCGYWKHAEDLETSQEHKLDLVCKKLHLQEGQHVLDIGCGWGSFAKFAAENYGARVTGITISTEQVDYARENCKNLPIEIIVKDYRLMEGKFDHIVSLGMFEHVGNKNFRTFFQQANRCLKDDGLFLLHTIGGLESNVTPDPWIHKYIFPNGQIPSLAEISAAAEKLFLVEDVHNFGAYYDKTLMAWFDNFHAGWDEIKVDFDERFYRMWKYYLNSFIATFRTRRNHLWQIVFSKKGVQGGYDSVR